MPKAVVTGGAGFIGSHIADALVGKGWEVAVVDSMEPPSHTGKERPDYLPQEAGFHCLDCGDEKLVSEGVLEGADVVFHEAAYGGFAPQQEKYLLKNSVPTLRLVENCAKAGVKKIVVASSMAVYGEGAYECAEHGVFFPQERAAEALQAGEWEVRCPECGKPARAVATAESKPVSPALVYSITKYDQERLAFVLAKKHGLKVAALRYFLTYGPRQSLSNPYTGICSIFSSRILAGKPPVVFEDGLQTRDFACVGDVVKANLLVAQKSVADGKVYNVGTGTPTAIKDFAALLCKAYESKIRPLVTGWYRPGDVRHIFADNAELRKLGWKPEVGLEEGIAKYAEWVRTQNVAEYFSSVLGKMKADGTVKKSRAAVAGIE